MNTQRLTRRQPMQLKVLFCAVILLSAIASIARATDLSYAAVPPFYSTGVQPNVGLIIDNSSSMTATDTGGSGSITGACTGATLTQPMTRIAAAKNAACQVIKDNASSMRIGIWDFQSNSPGGGNLLNNIGTATQAQLVTSVSGISESSFSYGTPLADAVSDVVTTFFGSGSPIQYRCQKNFIVMFTDGSADAGIDENSTVALPSLYYAQQQTSTWYGATSVATGSNMVSPTTSWDGFPDVDISWLYPSTGNYYSYYTWLDDFTQVAYDVDIKDTTAPASGATLCGTKAAAAGVDCAGGSWDDPAFKQQNITPYMVGFGGEANNEALRDAVLVNQISILPSQVSVASDTITIANHGLSTGDYVIYSKSYSSPALVGTADTGTGIVTVTSGGTVPASGTAVTYAANGTSLTYDVSTPATATCGSIGGLTSGSTNNFVSVPLSNSAEFRLGAANASLAAFGCANTVDGGANAKCTALTSTGTQYTTHTFTVTAHTASFLAAAGTTPINTTSNTYDIQPSTTVGHGFNTGNQVKYTATSGSIGGLSTATTYYVAKVNANTFRLATTSAKATLCAGYTDGNASIGTNCVALTSTGTAGATIVFTNTTPANDNASVTITAGAAGSTSPVNITTNYNDIIPASNPFITGDQVTYTCANGSYNTHSNASATTYYVNQIDSSHFYLSLLSAATPTLTITNAGNAAQTFTYTMANATIGGLYPYVSDQQVTTTNPVYSTSSPSGGEGKYFVEYVDNNTIKLHQCGAVQTVGAYTVYCTLPAASAVNITSTGYGMLSTGPGKAYFATTAQALSDDLQAAFLSISGQKLSEASLTGNVSTLASGAFIYTTAFNSSDWSGDIMAYSIDATTGAINTIPTWQASKKVPSSRNLITWTGSTSVALPSVYSGLSATPSTASEQTSIGSGGTAALTTTNQNLVLGWMAGTDQSALPGSRTRSNGVIGDIMGGSPVYVGSPSGSFDTLLPATAAGQSSYLTFKSSNSSRTPMLYAGANDGMLHGVNASTGAEVFGYIPQGVYVDWVDTNATSANNGILDSGEVPIQKFYELTQAGYGYVATQPHRFFVDGAPTAGDAYFSTSKAGIAANSWHTVVVGGLGKGGRSIYALDVTNPTTFTSGSSGNVLWEFNDSSDTSGGCLVSGSYGCMGYTYSKPQIARVNSGSGYVWAAIFGNGYNAASDLGHLYVVNIETGALIKRIDTGVAGGLSTVTAYTPKSGTYQGVATTVYAGDLLGNIWRFDLSNATPANWTAFKLFTAKDSSNNAQPITEAPLVADATALPYSLSGGVMVTFGTGTYFQTSDLSYDVNPVYDSMYSIWDKDGTAITSSQLQASTVTTSGGYLNVTSTLTNPWPTTGTGSRGWYLNLTTGASPYVGERSVFTPIQIGNILIFDTVIPTNTDPCTGGGTSWFYGIDAVTGGFASVFDLTGSGTYSTSISAFQSTVGVLSQPFFVASSANTYSGVIYAQGSNGTVQSINICFSCKSNGTPPSNPSSYTPTSGRMTWRQLQ
jgi:Tfp pilus tip-associated adhesin PilY1